MTSDETRVDPRTRRTLAALRQALVELLETTPLSQITVSELCRTAGVHRTTFYKHFDTVGEVASDVVAEVHQRIVAPSGEEERGLVGYRLWLTAFLEHLQANAEAYAGVLGPAGDTALVRAVCDDLIARVERHLLADVEDGAWFGTDVDVVARVLGFASWGAVESVLVAGESVAAVSVTDVASAADVFLGSLRRLIADPVPA